MLKLFKKEIEQGFIDQYGRFLICVEARKIAVENGQYKLTEQEYGELYSENLY